MNSVSTETFPGDVSSLTTGQFLHVYKQLLDMIDVVNADLKRLNKTKGDLQQEAIRRCNLDEVTKISGDGLTVTVKEQATVKVNESADWSGLISSLVDDGYAHFIQRRLSAAKLQEEVDSGYRLPEGLELGTVQVATHRRS